MILATVSVVAHPRRVYGPYLLQAFGLVMNPVVISEESRMGEGRFADRSMALWPIAALEHAAAG